MAKKTKRTTKKRTVTKKTTDAVRKSTLNGKQLASKLKSAYGYKMLRLKSMKIGTTEVVAGSLKGLTFEFKRK